MARMPDQLPTARAPRGGGGRRMPARDVSSGLGRVAAVLDGIAETEIAKRERAREQDDAVMLATAATRFRQRHTERLLRESDETPDEAIDGFSDRFGATVESDAQAETDTLPERLRARARLAFIDTGADLRMRAVDVEHGRRVDRQGRLLEEQVRTAGATVRADPTQFAALLDQSRAAVEGSGLPEAAQGRLLAELPRQLANDRLMGLVDMDPYAARRELTGGEWNETLSAQEVSRHLDAANAEIRRREAEAERRRAAAQARLQASLRTRMEDDLASIEATGRPVVQLSEVERVFGAEAADSYATQRREAEQNHLMLQRWRFLPPDEIEQEVTRAGPRGGEEGFAAAQERQQRLATMAQRVIEARRDDPASAALAADPALRQMWEGLAATETDAQGRRVIVAQMFDRQTRLGIPAGQQRLTTNTQAAAYASRIRDAGEGERARAMEEVTGEIGALYGAHAGRALAEVARAAEMPELTALAAAPDEQSRRRVARALGAPEPQLRPDQTRVLNRAVDRALAPLAQSLALTPGGGERLAQVREAARRAAAVSIAAGESPETAANGAARIYTQSYQFRDGLRMPRTWNGQPLNAGAVARGARQRVAEAAESGDFQLPAGRGDVAEADSRAAARDSFMQSARWVSAPNDRGLILVDEYGDAIRDREGREIAASWDELMAASTREREARLLRGWSGR
jgi:hypothetical protein